MIRSPWSPRDAAVGRRRRTGNLREGTIRVVFLCAPLRPHQDVPIASSVEPSEHLHLP